MPYSGTTVSTHLSIWMIDTLQPTHPDHVLRSISLTCPEQQPGKLDSHPLRENRTEVARQLATKVKATSTMSANFPQPIQWSSLPYKWFSRLRKARNHRSESRDYRCGVPSLAAIPLLMDGVCCLN